MSLSDTRLSVPRDALHERLQVKHAHLRLQHLAELQKTLEVDQSAASKRMHKLPPSLDLISDEIAIILNELSVRCEEHGVPQANQLLKEARTLMNRQLREAYSYLEEGYTSGYSKLHEESAELRRRREVAGRKQTLEHSASALLGPVSQLQPSPPADHAEPRQEEEQQEAPTVLDATVNETSTSLAVTRHQSRGTGRPKTLAIDEALSATTGFFAETLAVILHCEVVRIYLYDEYSNLNCCVRYPPAATQGDPMSATHLELMLAKEIHRTVCRKCIAVNGTAPQKVTLSERDRETMEEELQQSGWKSMQSCLIFPIFSSIGVGRSFGMIHAVNKQGVAVGRVGHFDDSDEVVMSIASRLLGCLFARYPVKLFTLPVARTIRNLVDTARVRDDARTHLPLLIEDEVEGAAVAGNKAAQLGTRILMYRAPINAIYQTRMMRKKARRLETLNMVDRGLSTVEFDLSALEELWKAGHEENVVMYKHCQHLNERVNVLQILLRNVLDGIGASRAMANIRDLGNYLRVLELYARRENTTMIAELIAQALLNSKFEGPILEDINETEKTKEIGRLTPNEAVRIERRMEQTPAKLKFFDSGIDSVRTYSSDPQKRREQVRFFGDLANQRSLFTSGGSSLGRTSRYESDTKAAAAKRTKQQASTLITFGPTDYAAKRPFRLEKK